MPEYKAALDKADVACVFYSRHAMEIKKMPELDADVVRNGFAKPNLAIARTKEELETWLQQQPLAESNVVLMSSGSYDGLNLKMLTERLNEQ